MGLQGLLPLYLLDFYVVFASERSCFSWDFSFYLKYECGVINEYIISLYVWVEVYVGFLFMFDGVVTYWPTGV
jgi:hypothetical protein